MLLQYRLHELDEVRREQIDTLLIGDPDFAAAMQEAEYDLLDAYAARELSESDRLRIERALHPVGRFSLEAPGRVIRRPAAEPAPAAPIRETPAVQSPRPRRMLLWAMAAVLALFSVLAVSLWRSHAGASGEASVTPPALAPQPAPPAAPIPSAARAPAPAAAPPQSAIAEVILPATLRSQSALQLKIASTTRTVRFLWPRVPAAGAAYELQLVGDDGAERCRSRSIAAGRTAVQFSCPSAQIPAGASFLRVLTLPATPDDAPLLEIAVNVIKSR